MQRLLTLTAFLIFAAAPATAQAISHETDHVLWCASAYAQLANDASEQSDNEETELYDRLAATLTKKGIALLRADRVSDDRISSIIQSYDDAVYIQLETPAASYPVESCESLLHS